MRRLDGSRLPWKAGAVTTVPESGDEDDAKSSPKEAALRLARSREAAFSNFLTSWCSRYWTRLT